MDKKAQRTPSVVEDRMLIQRALPLDEEFNADGDFNIDEND